MQINNLEINKLEKSVVEIKGEIDVKDFEAGRDSAILKLSEHIEVDGFRKGKAPKDMVLKKLGDQIILEEMAQVALNKAYPQIIMDNKIDAIGYPQINITKLASNNPLGFTITTAVIPEIKLPDYKSIAKAIANKAEKAEVTEQDVKGFITKIKKMKAHDDFHKNNPDIKGHDHAEVADEELPELDIEYLKTLGDFKDMEDFRTKVKEDILKEKEFRAQEKNRLEIMEAIGKEALIDVPDILVNSEIDKMISRMKSDISKMGFKYDDYLKNIGKSEEAMRDEFRGDAESRAKIQMVVGEIAVQEKIRPEEAKVLEEIKKITEIYKDVDEANARNYIESVLINEEVFKFLENQK